MRFIKIDSLGEIITGKTPSTKNKSFYNGPYPFITPTDLNDSIHVHTSSTISEAGAATQLGTIIPKNSVCFTCIASIGKMCITERPSITNQQINSIIVNQEKYDYRYVYYLLRYHTSHIAAIAIGSATPIISKARFSEILLPVETDISIQHTIADILSAYDNLIENNQKQIKLLEEAAQHLYKEWFVDLRFPGWENTKIVDGVPEGWHIGLLSELISVNYGKDHKKVPNTGDIPVYGSGGIMRKCNKSLYSGESVLIPRKGSLNNIMYVNESFWTVDTMFFTIPQKAHSAIFTYFFVSGIDMYSFNIGAAVPSMTVKILDNLSLVIPDSSFFEKFDMFVQPYFKKIKLLRMENGSLIACRNSLLYHFFRSEHT